MPRRPAVGPWITQYPGPSGNPTRRCCHGSTCSHAQLSIPTSRRLLPLPWRTSTAPRRASRSVSASASASASPMHKPARHSTTIRARRRVSISARARSTHHGDDFLDGGRVCWVASALVAGWTAGVIAREGDGLAPVAGGIEEDRVHQHLHGESRFAQLSRWQAATPGSRSMARCRTGGGGDRRKRGRDGGVQIWTVPMQHLCAGRNRRLRRGPPPRSRLADRERELRVGADAHRPRVASVRRPGIHTAVWARPQHKCRLEPSDPFVPLDPHDRGSRLAKDQSIWAPVSGWSD